MSGKFREQDTELLDGVCVNASDSWHGRWSSPSAVAMCRSCGSVANNVTKVDSINVIKVLCEDVWWKRFGGQSRWSKLLVATYSSCGSVADGREEDDVMVIMVGATGSISGSVALMWMLKLYQLEGIELVHAVKGNASR